MAATDFFRPSTPQTDCSESPFSHDLLISVRNHTLHLISSMFSRRTTRFMEPATCTVFDFGCTSLDTVSGRCAHSQHFVRQEVVAVLLRSLFSKLSSDTSISTHLVVPSRLYLENPCLNWTREGQEHEDGEMLSTTLCSRPWLEGRAVGSPHVSIHLDWGEDERTVPIVAFACAMRRTRSRSSWHSKFGITAATCCHSKSPTTCAVRFLVGMLRHPSRATPSQA